MITLDDLDQFGRGLLSPEASEVQLRAGAGRLYYAAFHRCRISSEAHCNELPEAEEKKRGSHQRVYARLEGYCRNPAISNKRLKLICQKAREMLELRVRADYDLGGDFLFKDAREMQSLLFNLKREFGEVEREIARASAV